MSKSILVSGATGTIGSFVLDQLQVRGADFVALTRDPEKARKLNKEGIKTAVGDFADAASMEKALEGIDKFFMLSVTSPDIPELQGRATEAARKAGVRHIVKISARGASHDSSIGIHRFHAGAEDRVRESGIPYTFLRPEAFMQNLIYDRETISEQGVVYSQTGDGRIAMIDARDIAAAAVESLMNAGHEGKTYVLTGPEAISYHDIANALTEQLGRPIRYVPVTSVQSRSSMLEAGMPEWLVEDLVGVAAQHAEGLASEVSPDLERVTGSKGFTIQDFLRDFRGHFH